VIRWFGGHLGGESVSALVDGQLDTETAERAWQHVMVCSSCRAQVERESWIKRRIGYVDASEPSARLLGSLQNVPSVAPDLDGEQAEAQAWATVDELEERGRGRRRAGLALAGVGSVSAAVVGFAALGTLGLGGGSPATSIGGTPSPAPTTATVQPTAVVHGRLPGWRLRAHDPDLAPMLDALMRGR
jgi:hypothetical protein